MGSTEMGKPENASSKMEDALLSLSNLKPVSIHYKQKPRSNFGTSSFLFMASSTKLPFVLLLSSLFLHASLAEIICESLPKDVCAFSISSSGKRCLLETLTSSKGSIEYQCNTSEVVVERMSDYVETDKCVRACGVDRNTVGISSDALLEPEFVSKLCSPGCYQKCPNIVDLYFNLAAGEGAFLPDLCKANRANPRRIMFQLSSSGAPQTVSTASSPTAAPTISA